MMLDRISLCSKSACLWALLSAAPCVFVGFVVSGPMPSFYQHVVAFRSCIKSQYHGPTAQQVLSDMQGGIGSSDCWRGLESLLYLSPSFRTFTTCVSEMVRLCAHALTAYQCDSNLFTCIITAVPYYIHCDQTLMGLLKHNLVRVKYGESVSDIAFSASHQFFQKKIVSFQNPTCSGALFPGALHSTRFGFRRVHIG